MAKNLTLSTLSQLLNIYMIFVDALKRVMRCSIAMVFYSYFTPIWSAPMLSHISTF